MNKWMGRSVYISVMYMNRDDDVEKGERETGRSGWEMGWGHYIWT